MLQNFPDAKIIFVDENAQDNERIFNFPVVRTLPQDAQNIFVAIGDNAKRRQISSKKKLVSVISARANVFKNAVIESGCFIGDGAYIGPFVHVGKGSIINTNAVVEHEVKIGEFCHLAPNSTVCGRTMIGHDAFVGAGVTIKDSVSICANVTIGSGGVVINNVEESGVYVGVPVRKIK